MYGILREQHRTTREEVQTYIPHPSTTNPLIPFIIPNPHLLRIPENLIIITAKMHRARAIRAGYVLKLRLLRLALERSIATAQQRVADVVEAMVIVRYFALVEFPILVAYLHDEAVDETVNVHQAVEFVEDGDSEDFFAGCTGKVHWFGKLVGRVVWYVLEAAAA
jgi:hypothetical protein